MSSSNRVCKVCFKSTPPSGWGIYCSEACLVKHPKKKCQNCLPQNKRIVEIVFKDGTKHYKEVCNICLRSGDYISQKKARKKLDLKNQAPQEKRTEEPKILTFNKNLSKYKPSFYTTAEWLHLRYKILKEQGAICALCGSIEKPMHVDHIKPRSLHPKLELDPNNLQVLCMLCNIGKSNTDETDFRK